MTGKITAMRTFWLGLAPSRLALLCTGALLSGCEYLLPEGIELGQHRVVVEQGNVLAERSIYNLHLGMDQRQVLFVLGTPLVRDPFHPNRWEYPFFTEASRSDDQAYLDVVSIHFDDEGKLQKIQRLVPYDPDIKEISARGNLDVDHKWFNASDASIPYPEETPLVAPSLPPELTPLPEPAPLPNLGGIKTPADVLPSDFEEGAPFVPPPPEAEGVEMETPATSLPDEEVPAAAPPPESESMEVDMPDPAAPFLEEEAPATTPPPELGDIEMDMLDPATLPFEEEVPAAAPPPESESMEVDMPDPAAPFLEEEAPATTPPPELGGIGMDMLDPATIPFEEEVPAAAPPPE